ncbi:MAG: bifunctional 5,10-methylenetetrahydrofolate dehydrogenase/5,10-methenyltetrahydrofolate cyclohydrolase [Candidatus Saccharibacteria bacterium]
MAKSKILYGKPLADAILGQVAEDVKQLKKEGVIPSLMTVQLGEDPASGIYLASQRRIGESVGINFEHMELSESTSQDRLLKILDVLNNDPAIHGIILHMPLPKHIDARYLQWNINRKKDVEGVTPYNLGRLFLGLPALVPCTALSVVELIKSVDPNLEGKEVVVVGHSDIVGKPVTVMLLQQNCTVTVCHLATSERDLLDEHVRRAEVVVAAVGSPGAIKGEWIKPGAIVIDVGINAVDDKIVGDVEFEEAGQRAGYITPVPGGVGTVTVAFLMKNLVDAVRWQRKEEE